MGFGFGMMTTLFPILFFLMFAFIMGMFIVTAVKGLSRWGKNNASPVLTVEAEVVSKRNEVTHHMSNEHHHSSTHYYVTFQVESGSRMELSLTGEEFGLLAEGDCGKLTFQGTRYQGFQRYIKEGITH